MERFTEDFLVFNIEQLYSNIGSEDRKKCDQYLRSFQQDPGAWETIIKILNQDHHNEKIYLFCAVTLKKKLVFDFYQISFIDFSAFKQSLFSLALRFSQTRAVLRQLALCISLLAIHLSEKWSPSLLLEIKSAFNSVALLEILKNLAEEVENKELVVEYEKIAYLKAELQKNSSVVFSVLLENSQETELVVQVFVAWVRAGLSFEVSDIVQSGLFDRSFELFLNEDDAEKGFSLLSEIINLTGDKGNEDLIEKVRQKILEIWPRVCLKDKEDPLFSCYAKVYCNFAEIHLKLMMSTGKIEIFCIMAELYRTKLTEVLDEITVFWHRACKMYLRHEFKEIKEQFERVLQELLRICICHLKSSAGETAKRNVVIVIEGLSDVLGTRGLVQVSFNDFNRAFGSQDFEDLCQVEAICFCLSAFVSKCTEDLFEMYLNEIIDKMTRKIWIRDLTNLSVCELLAKLEIELPEGLANQVLAFLIGCLENQFACQSCSAAFKKICEKNAGNIGQEVIVAAQRRCFMFSEDVHNSLLEGICLVSWRSLDSEPIISTIQPYSCLLCSANVNILVYACDKLNLIFEAPVLQEKISASRVNDMFKALWPTLKQVVISYSESSSLSESVCRVLKQVMRKLKEGFFEYIDDVFSLIHSQYLNTLHSAYLYLVESLLKAFHSYENYKFSFVSLFEILAAVTISFLSSTKTENPDLFEDFFGMNYKYLRCFSYDILDLTIFPQILQFSVQCIGIKEAEAGKCLYKMLGCVFELSVQPSLAISEEKRLSILLNFKSVLYSLFVCIVSVIPSGLFPSIQDLVFSILSSQYGFSWVKAVLEVVPDNCLTAAEKEKFCQSVLYGLNLYDWVKIMHKRSKNQVLRLIN